MSARWTALGVRVDGWGVLRLDLWGRHKGIGNKLRIPFSGWAVSGKGVEPLWRQEGLKASRKRAKRRRLRLKSPWSAGRAIRGGRCPQAQLSIRLALGCGDEVLGEGAHV